ncbi:SIS domain-containing protein [Streptomyces triticagri]|uniref:Glutamine--fructose-6-phosphate aminotransferase [isomerizing] n=1 Tax=Streptomyces triticagri TaxID=2293568 RepID=A0A372M7Y5_9ACTN|nr:SIS domain-containing protein [Streptomyces triticagri]RFU86625.1 SIS domain-containing protein [Streptomyces triticagri]
MDIDVLTRQTSRLGIDLATLMEPVRAQVEAALSGLGGHHRRRVCIVGDGDSYHAGCAAETAFELIGDVICEPQPAQRFLSYHVDTLPKAPGDSLIVLVSASGRTERVLEAAAAARDRGLVAIAVTGNADSPLALAADASVDVSLPEPEPSPGIRTYQASLLALLLLAVQLSAHTGSEATAQELCAELVALATTVSATEQALRGPCEALGHALSDAPVIGVLGTGPSEGTAKYGAAKLVEGAGVMAFGQDLEEWCHVERFAGPLDMPLVIVAPSGKSQRRARDVALRAATLGRRVIILLPQDDEPLFAAGLQVLPIPGSVREPFSPLVYHLFAGHLAAGLARHLGRRPFQSHRPTGPAKA